MEFWDDLSSSPRSIYRKLQLVMKDNANSMQNRDKPFWWTNKRGSYCDRTQKKTQRIQMNKDHTQIKEKNRRKEIENMA